MQFSVAAEPRWKLSAWVTHESYSKYPLRARVLYAETILVSRTLGCGFLTPTAPQKGKNWNNTSNHWELWQPLDSSRIAELQLQRGAHILRPGTGVQGI